MGAFLLAEWVKTGHADAQLQNGLVGYWSFNEGTGNAAMDSSGNGNTGMLLNGPSWSSGKSGLALALDGANDYVEVSHAQSLNLSSALTVSVWVNNETLMDSGSKPRSIQNHRLQGVADRWRQLEPRMACQ